MTALRNEVSHSARSRQGFKHAYADILKHASNSYRTIILHLRDKPDEGCVIHCTAGKDRTGVICALLLSLAGVEDDRIAEEYELTELGLAPMRPMIVEHLLQDPALAGDREGALRMVGARAENMVATLGMIREMYGGAEGYIKGPCGFSDEDVVKIRENLRAKEKPMF